MEVENGINMRDCEEKFANKLNGSFSLLMMVHVPILVRPTEKTKSRQWNVGVSWLEESLDRTL